MLYAKQLQTQPDQPDAQCERTVLEVWDRELCVLHACAKQNDSPCSARTCVVSEAESQQCSSVSMCDCREGAAASGRNLYVSLMDVYRQAGRWQQILDLVEHMDATNTVMCREIAQHVVYACRYAFESTIMWRTVGFDCGRQLCNVALWMSMKCRCRPRLRVQDPISCTTWHAKQVPDLSWLLYLRWPRQTRTYHKAYQVYQRLIAAEVEDMDTFTFNLIFR